MLVFFPKSGCRGDCRRGVCVQVTITNREEETIKNWYLAVTLPAAANISRTYSFNHGNQTHLGKREIAHVWGGEGDDR